MRFVQFYVQGSKLLELGLKSGDGIISLSNLISQKTLLELLRSDNLDALLNQIKTFAANDTTPKIPLSNVTLASPILSPDKVICVGMNYRDHCEEQNVPVPEEPIIFSKFASSIVGPYDSIPYPEVTDSLDYEVELAFVIGKKAKNVSESDAPSHIFGYTVAHDVSARDWQFKRNGGQWLLGKTMDGFCPLGPEIVTTDELKDPHNLFIRCKVNDETVQDSHTSQLVHRVEAILSFVSKCFTLLPGDVILTGTPPGVGVFRKPQRFLKIGEVVECSIENLGTIRNEIVKE